MARCDRNLTFLHFLEYHVKQLPASAKNGEAATTTKRGKKNKRTVFIAVVVVIEKREKERK